MQTLTKRALRVFSVLERYGEGSNNPLDSLLPFFEPLLSELDGQIYDPADFAKAVREQYRWNFTRDIAEEFCGRFAAKGWLTKVTEAKGIAVFQINHPSTSEPIGSEEASKLEARLHAVAVDFSKFVADISPLTAFDRSYEEFADILVEWLVSIDAYSEDVLRYSVHTGAQNDKGKLGIFVNIPDTSTLTDEERFLAARFVKKLFDEGSEKAIDLCKLASVGLLTEVVQDFQKPLSSVKKTDLCIYLDAPVAMDLLGVSGKAAKENIAPILNEFNKIGGSIRICRTSLDEIKGALFAVLNREIVERTGPTADALRRGEVLEAYVRQAAANPHALLEELFGVQVDERTLEDYPAQHQYFTEENNEAVIAGMGFHVDLHRKERDAHVITAVMRRRQGFETSDLFGSRHVLLTRNGVLAQFARRFCRENGFLASRAVGPAIHQRELATAVWLRTGLSHESTEIPKRYVLAACEKVLEIKKGLVEHVRKMARDLTADQAEQLDLLLLQDRSIQHLQDKTLGGVHSIVSASDPNQLLDTLKEGLIDVEKAESEKKIREIKRESHKKLTAEKAGRIDAEKSAGQLTDELQKRDQEDREVIIQTLKKAEKRGSFARRTLKGFLALILIVFAYYLAFGSDIQSPILKGVLFMVFGVIFPILLAFLQMFGAKIGINQLANWLMKKWFFKQVRKKGLTRKLDRYAVTFANNSWELDKLDSTKDSVE